MLESLMTAPKTVLAAVVLSTCFSLGSVQAQSMIGSWAVSVKVDEAAAKKVLESVKDQQQKQIIQLMMPAMKGMTGTLDVRQDGTYTMTVEISVLGRKQTNKETGTWKLVKSQGKTIVIETIEKGKTKKDTHTMTRHSDDHFSEAAPDEMGPIAGAMKMEYRRKK